MGVGERSFYTRSNISGQRETNTDKHCYEHVKKLLEKLPESERTIIILYYLGEMTTEEISKCLGVSANTIANRLQRARRILKEDEVLLIQEVLGGVQMSESILENTMRRVAEIKPTSVWVRKRFLFTSFTILVIAIVVVLVLKLL